LQIDARLYQNRLQYRELALIWLGLRWLRDQPPATAGGSDSLLDSSQPALLFGHPNEAQVAATCASGWTSRGNI